MTSNEDTRPEPGSLRAGLSLCVLGNEVTFGPFGEASSPLPGKGKDQTERLLRALACFPHEVIDGVVLAEIVGTSDLPQVKVKLPPALRKRVLPQARKGLELHLDLDSTDYLDLHDFLETVRKFGDLRDTRFDELDEPTAELALSELDRVLDLWTHNPAKMVLSWMPRKGTTRERNLQTVYTALAEELEDAKYDAEMARDVCRVALATHDDKRRSLARKSLTRLNSMLSAAQGDRFEELPTRSGRWDEMHWYTLLGAYLAAGRQANAAQQYQNLRDLYARARLRFPDSIARLEKKIGIVDPREEERALLPVLRGLGITTDSALSLEDARMDPLTCIERTERQLWFAGVLASKWVDHRHVYDKFEALLTRLDEVTGAEVRFLIVNPLSDAYAMLNQLREGQMNNSCVRTLRRLSDTHSSFEVRVFATLPTFRIIAMDDDVVTFSAYQLDNESYGAAKGGWESPHVVLDPTAPFPLSRAFASFFTETWKSARDISEVDLDLLDPEH